LEPGDFHRRYVAAPDLSRRTKEGKAAWAAVEADNPDAEILRPAEWPLCATMPALLARGGLVTALVRAPGPCEISAVAEVNGVLIKVRPDKLCDIEHVGSVVLDLKFVRAADPWAFGGAVRSYGWATRAAVYLDVLSALAPHPRRYLFLAVEKEEPHGAAGYELDDETMGRARQRLDGWIKRYQECLESGIWPGYPDGIEPVHVEYP